MLVSSASALQPAIRAPASRSAIVRITAIVQVDGDPVDGDPVAVAIDAEGENCVRPQVIQGVVKLVLRLYTADVQDAGTTSKQEAGRTASRPNGTRRWRHRTRPGAQRFAFAARVVRR